MASYLTLSEIPTLTQQYRSNTLRPPANTYATPLQSLNDILSHIQHDITKLEIGCIVNAANTRLLGGGGVDGSIHAAAGRGLYRECLTLDGCVTGDAKMTDGHDLPAKKIAHAVGPIYSELDHDVAEKHLRSCYRRSLELAVEHGQRSIAFSAISTGIYGYPHKVAAETAIDEVGKFLRKGDNMSKFDKVIFCSFMPVDVKAYQEALPSFFPPTTEDITAAEEGHGQTQDGS